MLGPAPIIDFDGTIAYLDIDWAALRADLGVATIADLWKRPSAAWEPVTNAEVASAGTAQVAPVLLDRLIATQAVGILTSNAEQAVKRFLARFPELERRVTIVVGRETLRGPKTEFAVFELGFRRCVAATSGARGEGPLVYVGDQEYELDFARRMGAAALGPSDVTPTLC